MAYRKKSGSKDKKVARLETKRDSHVDFEDLPELYPNEFLSKRTFRSRGKTLGTLKKAAAENSFCSYDVIQGFPEALSINNDQQHVVHEFRPVMRIEAPHRVHITEDQVKAMPNVYVVTTGDVKQIYRFRDETRTFQLTKTDVVAYSRKGHMIGVNGIHNKKGLARAKKNVDSFNKLSNFNQAHHPSTRCELDTEVGGEPMVISCSAGKGVAYDAKGNAWSFTAKQNFRILVECFPSVETPQRIFLTYAWRWNTVNNFGAMYNVRLMEHKQISFKFGEGYIGLEISPTLPVARHVFKMFGPNGFGRNHVDVLFTELRARFGNGDFVNDDMIDHIRNYYRRNKDLQQGIQDVLLNHYDHGDKTLKYKLQDH
jgi:hypothetical protein